MTALGAEGRRFESCLPDHHINDLGVISDRPKANDSGTERREQETNSAKSPGIVPAGFVWPEYPDEQIVIGSPGRYLQPQPRLCTIYFVGPANGPVKIGWASRLSFRLKDLRNANAYPLEVWATVEGPPLQGPSPPWRMVRAPPRHPRRDRAAERRSAVMPVNLGGFLDVDNDTVELCCALIEFRALGLSASSNSPAANALREAAVALRKFLLEPGE